MCSFEPIIRGFKNDEWYWLGPGVKSVSYKYKDSITIEKNGVTMDGNLCH